MENNVICGYCGKSFFKRPSQQKVYKRHFCCFECWNQSRRKTNEIRIKDDYAEIIINSPKYGIKKALINIEDIEKVKKYCWTLAFDKRENRKKFYVQSSVKNSKNILLHRIIANCPDNLEVDHINHNTFDNRRFNLKVCTHKENMQNYKAIV